MTSFNVTKVKLFISALCLALFFLFTGLMEDSTTLTLTSVPFPLILIQELAHRGHGHLVISLSNVSVITPRGDVDWTSAGFVLLSRGELRSWVSRAKRDRYGLDLIFAVIKLVSQPHDFHQLSRAVHNLLFYILETLIGVGLWKSISSLHQRVRTVTLITISLQIFADVALFAINGHRAQSIRDFKKWNWVFLTTNVMCFLPVMTLVVWSNKLQEGASEADEKKASSNNSSQLWKLMGMYTTGMGYLHFLYLLVFTPSVTAKVGRRTIVIAEEGAHLALCMVMLYQFSPTTKEASDYQNILENNDHFRAAEGKGDP